MEERVASCWSCESALHGLKNRKGSHASSFSFASWEPQLDTYKPQILKFFDLNHKLQLEVMRSIALGLKLEESYFDDKVSPPPSSLSSTPLSR